MRRWWSFVLAGCGVVLACSGSSGDGVPSDDTSADGGGGNKGDGGGGDAGTDADPNGCVTVGPRSGTVATSTPRTGQGAGGVAWQSPENARAADETPASADLSSADSTEDLLVSGYGFTGVTGMRVVGVEVELKREAPEAGVTDGEVFLTLDGQKSPMSHYLDLPWPTSIFGTHVYGGATDTWGMTLTEADVAKPGFGVSLYALKLDGGGAHVGLVDSLRVTVHYCP